jgi:hypothetical protein
MEDIVVIHLVLLRNLRDLTDYRKELIEDSVYWGDTNDSVVKEAKKELKDVTKQLEEIKFHMQPFLN